MATKKRKFSNDAALTPYTGSFLWVNQYGDVQWARTMKELKGKVGPGQVSKMYTDKNDGRVVHTGYVIGNNWWQKFQPVEIPA